MCVFLPKGTIQTKILLFCLSGIQGDTGFSGSPGPKGFVGDPGYSGIPGQPGTTGRDLGSVL